MCPACWSSIAITVATATSAGAGITALVVRATRRLSQPEPRKDRHDRDTTDRHA